MFQRSQFQLTRNRNSAKGSGRSVPRTRSSAPTARRDLLAVIGAAVVTSPMVVAQQKPLPVIGFLGVFAPSASAQIKLEQIVFRRGLGETGYVEGQNVAIEYWRGEGMLLACRRWRRTSSLARSM